MVQAAKCIIYLVLFEQSQIYFSCIVLTTPDGPYDTSQVRVHIVLESEL